jgi:biotin transport system substrate-specific component
MSSPIRSIVYTALFSALFIVMSAIKIPLPVSPVPITLQNLALMLAGAFLGARYGLISILLVCVLSALGLPLLGGQGGLAVVFGPTGGFVWMFPICAMAVGFATSTLLASSVLARNSKLKFVALFAVFMSCGSLLSYVGGVPWLAYVANLSLSKALALGMYPFLIGDLLKSIVATIVIIGLQPYIPSFGTKQAIPRS